MSIWGRIAELEHQLTQSRRHAHALESELHGLRAAAGHVDHSRPVPRFGVDYAWDRPDPRALRRAGVTFALRYLTSNGAGKGLSGAEARALGAAGIDVAVCFELGGHIEGFGAGERQAHEARAWADRAGVPHDRPIYFVCDFDAAGAGATGAVLEYLRGAVHALGWARVGLYAGYDVIEAAAGSHRCKYLWQTLAWSHGRWSVHAQLRQRQIERRVAGADCDIDEARAHDFGQWRR